jgi:ABC-type lipoprotein release transport system permease subunit
MSALGIAIGIWAILMSVSLSQGVSTKLVDAVNSQSFARLVQYYKTNPEVSDFGELFQNKDVKFVYKNNEFESKTIDKLSLQVASTAPSDLMSAYIHKQGDSKSTCVNDYVEEAVKNAELKEDFSKKTESTLKSKCYDLRFASLPFDLLYANNYQNWYGTKNEPKNGEIAICYGCSGAELFYKFMDVSKPEDLLGKKIVLEYNSLPTNVKTDTEKPITNPNPTFSTTKQSVNREFTIVSVYDDTKISQANILGSLSSNAYLNQAAYLEALQQEEPNLVSSQVGHLEHNVFIKSFEDLDKVISELKDQKVVVFSLGQFLAQAVKSSFQVLTVILALFSLISLVAAAFGIVNVMTVSVLERQKDIGILKSLGSTNTDIFLVFLVESACLGFIGWLFGVVLTWLTNSAISKGFLYFVSTNSQFKQNLSSLNITDFSLGIPFYALVGSLVLALLFTVVSGLFPSISAARQSPTEILRTE